MRQNQTLAMTSRNPPSVVTLLHNTEEYCGIRVICHSSTRSHKCLDCVKELLSKCDWHGALHMSIIRPCKRQIWEALGKAVPRGKVTVIQQ